MGALLVLLSVIVVVFDVVVVVVVVVLLHNPLLCYPRGALIGLRGRGEMTPQVPQSRNFRNLEASQT